MNDCIGQNADIHEQSKWNLFSFLFFFNYLKKYVTGEKISVLIFSSLFQFL